jgi:G:T/U-mismatch repair DNA glycosylase
MKNQVSHLAGSRRRIVVRPSERTPTRQWLTDRIKPGVRILFVGINPGLRSAATGHHFAGYSNRFWKLLFESKLVPKPLTHQDDWRLPDWGLGLTNIIQRPSAGIDVLKSHEYIRGRKRLIAKVNTIALTQLPYLVSRSTARYSQSTGPDESAWGCKPRPWPTALFLSCLIPAVGMPIIHIQRCSRRSAHCAIRRTCLLLERRRGRSWVDVQASCSKFLTSTVLSSQQHVATLKSILDKESDSKDIRTSMNWHIDCCIS